MIELLNLSINEALARTLMTASTVFVAVLALFAGPVLHSVSVAMLWGLRRPLFLDLERRRGLV
ncbi:hypothetical protein [Reyranella sp.]|uniref:hypothetical protein n=1 Tax=Reyranella sp. TaxID=1929291 RepID=UPI003D0998DE